jgi:hypothetical protein
MTARLPRRSRTRMDWQYALGVALDDPGFDHTVLSEFRTLVSQHRLEREVLNAEYGQWSKAA